MKAIRRFTVRTVLPDELAALRTLATNLRWTWHAPTRAVFAAVEPRLWEAVGRDPIRLLSEVTPERLRELATDTAFRARLDEAAADLDRYLAAPLWYQQLTDGSATPTPTAIAYFSAEYGLDATLPQYSGGLGILAGDHLKSASDLGIPVIGVGLLYRHGYFAQSLSPEGWQVERYPEIDPHTLPMTRLEDGGTPVRITVDLPDNRPLTAHVWVVRVGRIPLLLLDTYHDDNDPELRGVTDRLYGGGTEQRLRQELLLGIGGLRAVRAYCLRTRYPEPEVFHMNEGHAGFLGLERLREYIENAGLDFDQALEATRAGTVFTTHTPVPAGIDRFPRELVEHHFSGPVALPGIPVERVMALGAETYPGGDPNVFNMAVMGMRLAQRVNGVSTLHGAVSREMFGGLWPGFDVDEVPITSITNGVHSATWMAEEAWNAAQAVGISQEELETSQGWQRMAEREAGELWQMRRVLREQLIVEARKRLRASWRQRGATDAELAWIDEALDPEVLTVGFARRVPSYKRLTLMLRDPERLTALLRHPERPIQIIIAGKAHPADEDGKRLIQEIVRFSDDPRVRDRIVFLPDYDMALAAFLVRGCDVWLNNPLRPLEACGTSGMKAALNGCLNLSIRDGWWDEWFDGANGWAIPTADGISDPERRDNIEVAALYHLFEEQVTPLFYERDADGLPRRWLEMVKHSMVSLGPKVLATRMVREYVEQLYQPAALSGRRLAADNYRGARELAAWRQRVQHAWPGVRIEHVETSMNGHTPQVGGELEVSATVVLGGLDPDDVCVEVALGRVNDDDELVNPSYTELAPLHSQDVVYPLMRFSGTVPLDYAGTYGYTVRVRPRHPLLTHHAEAGLAVVAEPTMGVGTLVPH